MMADIEITMSFFQTKQAMSGDKVSQSAADAFKTHYFFEW